MIPQQQNRYDERSMGRADRKFHAIIVHFADEARTRAAVSSLQQHDSPDTCLVIDHAKKALQLAETDCQVIRPPRNRGYAAGLNIGLGALISRQIDQHDIVMCMNNDVAFFPDTMRELRSWWQRNPADALVGVSVQEHSATVGSGYVDLFTGRSHLVAADQQSFHRTLTKLPHIYGAFLTAPYKVFLELKGVPEKYFMYWEDPLLSQHASQHGIPIRFASSIRVRHQQSKSIRRREDQLYYLVRNGALFLEQETPGLWPLYWWTANRARLAWHTINPSAQAAVRQGLSDAVRRTTGRRPRVSQPYGR